MEPSLSFRFRNKFPPVALSTMIVSGGCFFSKHRLKYEFDLIINGSQRLTNFLRVRWSKANAFDTNLNHIILLELRLKASLDMTGKLFIKNGWNHAEISLTNKGEYMEWMRLHVWEQKSNMADVETINPDVATEGKEKSHTRR